MWNVFLYIAALVYRVSPVAADMSVAADFTFKRLYHNLNYYNACKRAPSRWVA